MHFKSIKQYDQGCPEIFGRGQAKIWIRKYLFNLLMVYYIKRGLEAYFL